MIAVLYHKISSLLWVTNNIHLLTWSEYSWTSVWRMKMRMSTCVWVYERGKNGKGEERRSEEEKKRKREREREGDSPLQQLVQLLPKVGRKGGKGGGEGGGKREGWTIAHLLPDSITHWHDEHFALPQSPHLLCHLLSISFQCLGECTQQIL